jgi:hypothetical protein
VDPFAPTTLVCVLFRFTGAGILVWVPSASGVVWCVACSGAVALGYDRANTTFPGGNNVYDRLLFAAPVAGIYQTQFLIDPLSAIVLMSVGLAAVDVSMFYQPDVA